MVVGGAALVGGDVVGGAVVVLAGARVTAVVCGEAVAGDPTCGTVVDDASLPVEHAARAKSRTVAAAVAVA